jgi:hypothetical protein
MEQYQEFLDTRKDAGPEISEIEGAKEKLKKLRVKIIRLGV